VLRVARSGEVDDERVIEIRDDGIEQIIQAQFGRSPSSQQLTPSRGGSLDSRTGGPAATPGVVACTECGSRFAAGTRFCGRCGNRTFQNVVGTGMLSAPAASGAASSSPATVACPRCQREYPSSIRFCGKCGIPIGAQSLDWRQPRPVEVVCKTCGGSYPVGTKFCGRCGKPISP
jgi:predicted amidophosphoribosyltransferase